MTDNENENGICAFCGTAFVQKPGYNARYCSATCRHKAGNAVKRARRHESRSVERTCKRCGKTFLPKAAGVISEYCPECRAVVRNERMLEWHRNHDRKPDPIIAKCTVCGAEFRKINVATVCPKCREERNAARSGRRPGRPRKAATLQGSETPLESGCTKAEEAEVMRVARFVPEAERWPITKNWPPRMRDMLRDIYLGIHEMR